MRNIILALILSASFAFSQQTNSGKFLLENDIKQSIQQINSNETYTAVPLQAKKKNAGLAILYSLILPGMGELYAEGYSSGKYFTVAEVSLWGVYFGVNQYGNWLKDRYTSYAASVGGVETAGKDEDYFAAIGEYMNVGDFNTDQALNRDFNEMYNTSTHHWEWNSSQERQNYRNMWVTSEQAFNSLRFVVGAMILNRVASVINAVRLVSAYNKRQQETINWSVAFGVEQKPTLPSSLTLNFSTSF